MLVDPSCKYLVFEAVGILTHILGLRTVFELGTKSVQVVVFQLTVENKVSQ